MNKGVMQEERASMPERIYRFFQEEAHAQALLKGHVWLSTIKFCKHHHDLADSGEGLHQWTPLASEEIKLQDRPDLIAELNADGLITIAGDCQGTIFQQNTLIHTQPDSYLFCATENQKLRRFGEYGVEIRCPGIFFHAVLDALGQRVRRTRSIFAPMMYGNRHMVEALRQTAHSALLGPEGNRDEQEVRMLFEPSSAAPIESMLVYVPEVVSLCRPLASR